MESAEIEKLADLRAELKAMQEELYVLQGHIAEKKDLINKIEHSLIRQLKLERIKDE